MVTYTVMIHEPDPADNHHTFNVWVMRRPGDGEPFAMVEAFDRDFPADEREDAYAYAGQVLSDLNLMLGPGAVEQNLDVY